jgi:hypothetical protein
MAANLHVPASFDESKTYPAIVVALPISSCKEQTAAIYASKLAELSYVCLAFDASTQGASAGPTNNGSSFVGVTFLPSLVSPCSCPPPFRKYGDQVVRFSDFQHLDRFILRRPLKAPASIVAHGSALARHKKTLRPFADMWCFLLCLLKTGDL